MGDPPPGESPPDGTEQHQNNSESILNRQNNIPYGLDHQEDDQWCHEKEVGERDQNGFTWDEFIPESLSSINSDFPLNEVFEHIDSIISDFASDESDLDIPFDGISEDNVSTDFHSLFNDGSSEQAINPIFAATSPVSQGEEVIPEEEREDTWEIGHNPVSWDDLCNDEMSHIHASLPHSPDENHNTTMSNLNRDIEAEAIEVIADSNSFGDALPGSGENPLEDLIRDLGLIPPQVTMHSKKECVPTTMGREPSVVTSVQLTSQQSKQNNKSAIDLGIELPKPFQHYHQLDLSDKGLDTAFLGAPLQSKQHNLPDTSLPGIFPSSNKLVLPGTGVDTALPEESSQSTRLGLSDTDLDAASLPGISSQSTQLDLSDTDLDAASLPGISSQSTQLGLSDTGLNTVSLPGVTSQSTQLGLSDTGLQQTLLSGTSTSSLRLDLPSIGVANQVGMVAMDVAVVTMVFPLPGHASNLLTWNNAGVVNDQAMKLPNLPSLEEKKRKRLESMKAASKRHRQKKKEKEEALIDKEERLLKENYELRDQRKRLSDEKEFYLRELKRRKEMHDSSKE